MVIAKIFGFNATLLVRVRKNVLHAGRHIYRTVRPDFTPSFLLVWRFQAGMVLYFLMFQAPRTMNIAPCLHTELIYFAVLGGPHDYIMSGVSSWVMHMDVSSRIFASPSLGKFRDEVPSPSHPTRGSACWPHIAPSR